ncbi:MAG: ATP-binding protein [Ignavibacteriaceae bacterium]
MLNRVKTFIKSTRFKTTIWYSLIFLVLEIVIGSVIYIDLSHSLNKQLDLSLIQQAELIYKFVSEKNVDFYNFIPDSIYSSTDKLIYDLVFEAVALNPTNTFIQIQYKDKTIFQTANLKHSYTNLSDTSGQAEIIKTFFDKNLSPHKIKAVVLNRNNYQIIAAFPISRINRALESLTDLYLIIAPIFLFISVVGGGFIAVKSLSRIDAIIEKTQYITTQNLEEKISGDEFDDEYGRLARTMNDMISRIKKSIDYMNQFSISAAHELKTPLTILRGEIELALRSEMTPMEYKEVLQSNLDETLRLINIVEKLFFVSKTDHLQLKINKEKMELKSFLLSTIESMRKIAQERNIKLNLICEDVIYAKIDAGLMKELIYNLIENAIKYSDPDGIVNIQLGKRNSGKFFISVSNKSEHIPRELHNKIFERFFRLETSRNRNTGGAGLGLSVVKLVVDLHGGEIEVDSGKNGFNVFTVVI